MSLISLLLFVSPRSIAESRHITPVPQSMSTSMRSFVRAWCADTLRAELFIDLRPRCHPIRNTAANGMTTFLLIRHASHDLLGRALAGRQPGVRLNERGQREAELLAQRLA